MSISIFTQDIIRSNTMSDRRRCLIRDHDIVRSEAPAIDGILIICLTLIVSSVFLRRRIDLHFRLYRVVTNGPLVHLAIRKIQILAIIRETFPLNSGFWRIREDELRPS